MTSKADFGRACEDFVAYLIACKTGFSVVNLNNTKTNHPVTDLKIVGKNGKPMYEVSVKAKQGRAWPAVKGVSKSNQFMLFVDAYSAGSPVFYILTNFDWQCVLKSIKPAREAGAKIVEGALQWDWVEDGVPRRFRGSQLFSADIESFRDNWSALPGVMQEQNPNRVLGRSTAKST